MITDSGKYYLYRHIRLDKNEPFYIGIGTKNNPDGRGKSIYERSYSKVRNKIWKDITSKTDYEVEILLESDNYDFIEAKEIEFIAIYGRINNHTGILSNLTNGGLGNYGTIASDHKRNRMKALMKGKEPWNKGIPCSKEVKLQISQSLIGNKLSVETINKRTKTRKNKAKEQGFYISDIHKERIGKANSKPVFQFSIENKFIEEFPSRHIAAIKTGVCAETIWRHCAGRVKKFNKKITKYIWKYNNN